MSEQLQKYLDENPAPVTGSLIKYLNHLEKLTETCPNELLDELIFIIRDLSE